MIQSDEGFTQIIIYITDRQYEWLKDKLTKKKPIEITEVEKI
ncbi:hypothetical protein LCGC14_0196050 [marine sediment metagenome]|uniref:Uncharacterized protein n=1 Tax=marine sediment metagenome TaxID=412755 RepID=A0A0F9V261_9ZZZZ